MDRPFGRGGIAVKKFSIVCLASLAAAALAWATLDVPATAQQPPAPPVPPQQAPQLPHKADANFLKYSADMNLGEVLGVAVNSKGRIVVLNHPGSATIGPLYGNASTQLLEFDASGKFVREIGKGVYGLGYGHWHPIRPVRQPVGGRQGHARGHQVQSGRLRHAESGPARKDPTSPTTYRTAWTGAHPRRTSTATSAPTDIAFDCDDNIYISDGYVNSRVAKFDKNGNWVKVVGRRTWQREPGQFNTPHNIAVDRQNNVYVADRNNRRIQVFDSERQVPAVHPL